MTDLRAETQALQESLRRYLELVQKCGVAADVRPELQQLREDLVEHHRQSVQEQTRTLKANLPPPLRGQVLRHLSARISFSSSAITQLDVVLSEVAA